MKTYAIIYRGEKQDRIYAIYETISKLFNVISCEFDDGICFVKTNESPERSLERIATNMELNLADTIYIFRISKEYTAAGTTKTIRALDAALEEDSQHTHS
ncbi:hypothetical protein KBB96_14565 [Luteolibacter ambystomatis]|uniref:Uncharacterized protein n=1 Tax=Luteolibacter ambystomatis TaxID=2824561 RepID=A0A975IY70_9BACT|nr:hypothetical protein [Luteolibacter ambystomatis]QUE50086.1 hypothetical protein KBB96_14565 [Luteolibacter ambystomatis]